jgi:ribosome production factor 2
MIRGGKTSNVIVNVARDLTKLKKPHAVFLSRKHEMRPFEAVNEVEAMTKKYDSSLFGFVSHNKKRPNNLILGRIYDQQILDMVELGVENFKSLDEFKNAKVALGTKPVLLFSGEPFQTPSSDFFRLKNLFVDFFRGEEVVNIRLEGIEHVLQFVALENKVLMRSYKIVLKKSGEKTPYVELEEIGPSMDFVLRRTKLASADLFKSACKQPKELKMKKVKNVSKDVFGSTMGRVHMPKQNLNKLPTRNMKALKRTPAEQKVERAGKKVERARRAKTVVLRNEGGQKDNPNLTPLGTESSKGQRSLGPTASALAKLNTSRPKMLLNLSS